MLLAEPLPLRNWRAELALGFERRGDRTVLAERRHDGPLVVQKPLYPEGEAVCHTIVVHPPAGIAGGDELELKVEARARAQVLLTTPGAGKWYRCNGARARQRLAFEAGDGACVEWLPQETIVFDGALAELATEVRLAKDACFIGWEVLCLGRTGSGERYAHGACRLRTELWRAGRRLWFEQGVIEGGGALMRSPAGLAGHSVFGTLVAAAPLIADDLLRACREVKPALGEAAVTRLPGVLIARVLGDSSEAAKRYFVRLWALLRPALLGRPAVEPRIWRT